MRRYSVFATFRVFIVVVLPTIAMSVLLLRLVDIRGILVQFVLGMLLGGLLVCMIVRRTFRKVLDAEISKTKNASPLYLNKLQEFEMLSNIYQKETKLLREKKSQYDNQACAILNLRNSLSEEVRSLRQKNKSFYDNICALMDMTAENLAIIDEEGKILEINANYISLIGENPKGKSIRDYLVSNSYSDGVLIEKIAKENRQVQGVISHRIKGKSGLSWVTKNEICTDQFLVSCSPVSESLSGKSLSTLQNREIDYINKINLSLTINKGTNEMLGNIAKSVKELFRINKIAVAHEEHGKWTVLQSEGMEEHNTEDLIEILQAYRDEQIEFLPDKYNMNVLVTRLYSESQEKIVMLLITKNGFSSDDLIVLKMFTHQATIVIQRSKSYEQLKKLFFNTVISLVDVIEAKDKYTEGHSKRVAFYSVELAKKLGYGEDEIEKIEISGVLHDVGKVSISQDILQKTGALTAEEFSAIKTHPWNGYKIIENINFDENIKQGVAYHHVRYDLKGYPDDHGLTKLPDYAAIIAVADAFDAMTSKRSYSKVKTIKQAKDELIRGRGSHFAPDMVDAMIELLDERDLILEAQKMGYEQEGKFRQMKARVQLMDDEAWRRAGVYENRK